MKAYDIIFNKVKELVDNKYDNILLKTINDGFEFNIPSSPYIFKIMCYDKIGWNVFLEPIGNIALVEHPETNHIYNLIENIVDEINYYHYDLDENIKNTLNENFNMLKIRLEAHSKHIHNVDRKELKYIIELNNVNNITPVMTIKYSIAMNKWTLEISDLIENGNIYDEYFEMYNDIVHLVEEFNVKVNSIDCYF